MIEKLIFEFLLFYNQLKLMSLDHIQVSSFIVKFFITINLFYILNVIV